MRAVRARLTQLRLTASAESELSEEMGQHLEDLHRDLGHQTDLAPERSNAMTGTATSLERREGSAAPWRAGSPRTASPWP